MAAGRYGADNDDEYLNRNANCEVSRTGNGYPREEFNRFRNGTHVKDHGVRGNVGSGRVRPRDANGGSYHSSSSRRDSVGNGVRVGDDPRRGGLVDRILDREPGEVSGESGSDDATQLKSRGRKIEVVETVVNAQLPPPDVKKRKFSPIVWDGDDKGMKDTSRSRSMPTITHFSQNHVSVVCKLDRASSNDVLPKNNEMLPIKSNKAEDGPVDPPVEVSMRDAHVDNDDVVEFPAEEPDSPFQDRRWDNHDEAVHLDDEDYISNRHISASRWAGDTTSPADEGEISDDAVRQKQSRKMPSSEHLGYRRSKRSSSLEHGKGTQEILNGTKGRPYDTDGSILSRPSSGDRGIRNEQNGEDYMDVDDKHNDTDHSLSPRETDSENEDDSLRIPEPPAPAKRTVNMLQGCRSVDEFERLNKIDEGTYGVVYRARDKKTGEIVALKKVKMEKEREGFPLTALREMNILLSLHHPSIVDVKEIVVGRNLDSIFMVMEYMEHDLKGLMESMRQPYSQSEVKCLMLQLLNGIKYLHDNWVLHRDLKTSNLLLNNQGELKICDFGLARQYGSPLKPYTHLVVTLWYRAPELLMGAREYSTAIDMWSLGCIMAELLSKDPLFNGKTEFDQLDKIFKILGTPNETIWPGIKKLPGLKVNFVKHQLPALVDSGLAFWPNWYNQLRKKFPATSFTGCPVLSDAGFDLLNRLLTYDPEKRITANAALRHEWFREVPLPKSKEFMPTFPAQHAQDRRLRRMLKSPDPLEEQRRKELQQPELGTGGLFG
ncbi:hypothetical protein KSS87_003336 [Heliosperma pusillum]|nr:hypothetical protein KSS87_003336 [Heliosperma pusillum]